MALSHSHPEDVIDASPLGARLAGSVSHAPRLGSGLAFCQFALDIATCTAGVRAMCQSLLR